MRHEPIESYLIRRYTYKTAETYLYYINVFLMKCPKASRMNYYDIVNYLHEYKTRNSKGVVLGTKLASIKCYYNYLQSTGQRDDHPCRKLLIKQRREAIQLQDFFSSAELETLMNRENRYKNLELHNKVILSFLIYQALTSAEIVRIELDDIDLDQGTVYIKGSKKLATRTLELRNVQIRLIQNYIKTSRNNLLKIVSNRLMINIRGTPDTVESIHSMVQTLQGLFHERQLSPLKIRQSVICNMLNHQKLPLESVQLYAGHKWPSSTEKYRRKDLSEQRDLINKLHPLI